MKLPSFNTSIRELSLLQSSWSALIEPFLSKPSNNSLTLKSVSLAAGTNKINHLLDRRLQGWRIVRQRAAGTVYDTQDSNTTPELTLLLVASAPMVVDIEVF